MIADISISKRGYAKMGISAAIGTPTLNLLIGIGVGTAIRSVVATDHIPDTANIFICCVCVLLQLTISIVFVSFVTKWKFTKLFGYISIVYYALFIVMNVLIYQQIIVLGWAQ